MEAAATDPVMAAAAAIGPDMEAAVATDPAAAAVSTPVAAAADSAAAPARPALLARASTEDSVDSVAAPATPTPLVRPSVAGRFILITFSFVPHLGSCRQFADWCVFSF